MLMRDGDARAQCVAKLLHLGPIDEQLAGDSQRLVSQGVQVDDLDDAGRPGNCTGGDERAASAECHRDPDAMAS